MVVHRSTIKYLTAVKLPNQLANKMLVEDRALYLRIDWIDRNCSTDIDIDLVLALNRTSLDLVRFSASMVAELVTFLSKYLKTTRVPMKLHRAVATTNL